jgi:PAS domain S-box-containing protein
MMLGALMAVLGTAVALLEALATRSDPRKTAAERSYTAFFDHALEGIFRSTVTGQYLDVNPALARIYGYESREDLMIGLTNIADQLYIDPSRRAAFQAIMDRDDQVTDFVSEIRRRDGKHIWISENARAVRDWTGTIVFYEGTVADVTDKIGAALALRKALEEAETAGRVKNAFLAAMSHELKTPLNAVLGFSEILKEELMGPLGSRAYQSYAADIHASGVRLLSIVNDVLDVARLQGGGVQLASEPCRIDGLVRGALAGARSLTTDARQVEMNLPPSLPEIDVDAARFQQVLTNLLSNAFKFTPAGGRVRVSARRTDAEGLRIVVSDTGIGMEPHMVEAALEPFRQIDLSLARRFEGTGLGLTIVYAVIRLHGGSLDIESKPGQGTSVSVILPPERLVAPPASQLEPYAAAM